MRFENQLFDWEEWDDDGLVLQFYRCTLNIDFPGFPKGSEMQTIVVDLEDSKVEFYDNVKKYAIATFDLKISVQEAKANG